MKQDPISGDFRHEKALQYAVKQLKMSKLSPYVKSLYLYGSYVRGNYKWDSDIDLFLVLDEDAYSLDLKKEILRMKSKVSQDDTYAVDVDLKVVYGDCWMENTMLYYQNILREGRNIWEG